MVTVFPRRQLRSKICSKNQSSQKGSALTLESIKKIRVTSTIMIPQPPNIKRLQVSMDILERICDNLVKFHEIPFDSLEGSADPRAGLRVVDKPTERKSFLHL